MMTVATTTTSLAPLRGAEAVCLVPLELVQDGGFLVPRTGARGCLLLLFGAPPLLPVRGARHGLFKATKSLSLLFKRR
jgi:hypothetical protein